MKRVLGTIMLFLAIFFLIWMFSPQKYLLYPRKYSTYVQRYSQLYRVDENLIYAVIKAESGFFPYATSSKKARGLMQITEPTLEWIKTKIDVDSDNLYDVETNIRLGTWYLSNLSERFGDTDLVIIAYNAGPSKTQEWIREGRISLDRSTPWDIPYPETKNYIVKVKNNYENYNRYYKK
ncbi:lytic transglycosylase domain-containing protein [Filifactor villosus]|uniref:Lytic transglycosylase domain-containing protein n=1 Tax=Filifactor villosus TaxID=29374 RepID=A0ABV9QK23_9FIRM